MHTHADKKWLFRSSDDYCHICYNLWKGASEFHEVAHNETAETELKLKTVDQLVGLLIFA